MSSPQEIEARRLRDKWILALGRSRRDDSDYNIEREQAAYDELVDFIEAEDLTYGPVDPRGFDVDLYRPPAGAR